jgi:hypothetical protein
MQYWASRWSLAISIGAAVPIALFAFAFGLVRGSAGMAATSRADLTAAVTEAADPVLVGRQVFLPSDDCESWPAAGKDSQAADHDRRAGETNWPASFERWLVQHAGRCTDQLCTRIAPHQVALDCRGQTRPGRDRDNFDGRTRLVDDSRPAQRQQSSYPVDAGA